MKGFRHCLPWALGLILLAGGGCATRDVNDFKKQEFVVQDKPVIHLALRGSRQDRKVVCQVFLLTTSETMWISGADLKLPNGAVLDPKRMESLEEDDYDTYPYMGFGFGFGYGRGYGYPYPYPYPNYRRYWDYGPYSRYRTDAWVSIPAWYLLGRPMGDETPSGIEFTFELPEGQGACDGSGIIVHVAIAPERRKKEERAAPVAKKNSKQAAEAEKKIRTAFEFVMTERPPPDRGGQKAPDPKKVIHEIGFTRRGSSATP